MAAIDLLFDHKAQSERLHQVVLSALLLRSRLLERVLGIPGLRATDFEWEAEKRLFDLGFTVHDPNGNIEQVLVELKIDSELGEAQFQRQIQYVAQKPKARLVYLILGLTQITVTEDRLGKWATTPGPAAAAQSPPFVYVDAARLGQWLSDPKPLLSDGELSQRREVRDLITAYREALDRLRARTTRFASRTVAQWESPDYYGFFAQCRDQIPSMKNAGISYEANPRGGVIVCNWKWTRLHPDAKLRIYLQMEESKLCLKLKVEDAHKAQRKKLWDAAQAALRQIQSPIALKLEPTNYHSGTYMTFASLTDVLGQGELDIARVSQRLAEAEALVDAMAPQLLSTAQKLVPVAPTPP